MFHSDEEMIKMICYGILKYLIQSAWMLTHHCGSYYIRLFLILICPVIFTPCHICLLAASTLVFVLSQLGDFTQSFISSMITYWTLISLCIIPNARDWRKWFSLSAINGWLELWCSSDCQGIQFTMVWIWPLMKIIMHVTTCLTDVYLLFITCSYFRIFLRK